MSSGPPFDVVFFDCDSTLSAVEGIDELARRAGVLDQTAPLTLAAMEGRMTLEEVYGRRLDLIRPDNTAIEWLGRCYVGGLVPGAGEVVDALRGLGKQVHVVSGGLRQAVLYLAERLAISGDRVHAVELSFDDAGSYAGFDRSSPLAGSGGKAEVCRRVVAEGATAALVGDGVTDLEAGAAGVFVVGFGGVARRQAVVDGAKAYVDGPSMLAVLEVLLTPAERAQRRQYASRHPRVLKRAAKSDRRGAADEN